MEIHQVNGRDLRDALERAHAALGGEAVVLSKRAGRTTLVYLAPRPEKKRAALRGPP